MATQVEHVENHLARLTTIIDKDILDDAMQDAARRLAGKINVPGFRKGKAPYATVIKYVGPQAVLEEALESLTQDVYQLALEESKVEPYAPGTLEDFKMDPAVQFTFTVPKQPTATLGQYREVRLPFETEEVTEEQMEDAVERLRAGQATTEVVDRGAQIGDVVKFHVLGEVLHDHGAAHDHMHDHEHAEGEEHDHDHDHDHGETEGGSIETFIDQDLDDVLTDNPKEDLVPGFSTQIVGMKAGEQKEFSIMLPEDFSDPGYANHKIEFVVDVEEVKSRTLPELNDDFAKLATKGEVETIESMRSQIRTDLANAALRQAETAFADKMIDEIAKDATVAYPEAMVDTAIDELIANLERSLRNNGLTLEQYKQIEHKTDEQIRADYRESAKRRVERSLVLTEIVTREGVVVSDDQIKERIAKLATQFGDQMEMFKEVLSSPENQRSIALDLLTENALARVVAIGRGENPPLPEGNIVPRSDK